MNKELLARPGQLLLDHLNESAELCRNYMRPFGLGETGYVLGVLHDIGKARDEWQGYLEHGGTKIPHSVYAAKMVQELYEKKMDARTSICWLKGLSNVVYSHHTGLHDDVEYRDGRIVETVMEESQYAVMEPSTKMLLKDFLNEIETHALLSIQELRAFSGRGSSEFTICFVLKLLFSALVDADRTSSAGEYSMEISKLRSVVDWRKFVALFSINNSKFSATEPNTLNDARRRILNDCIGNSKHETGMFMNDAKTGGGKTNSTMSFAVNHAAEHGMSRIVVVNPLKILNNQTSDYLMKVMGKRNFENHVLKSDSDMVYKEGNNLRYSADIAEKWDVPIIDTTLAQFVETIASAKQSKLRKLHNFHDVIFVFDEIQSLPLCHYALFINALNFLIKHANCSVVLCTATTPELFSSENGHFLTQTPTMLTHLPPDMDHLFERFTLVDSTLDSNGSERYLTSNEIVPIAKELSSKGSLLIITNTVKSSRQLKQSLENSMDCPIVLVNTGFTPHDREIKLEDMKKRLAANERFICISTQMMQAGVDLSFTNGIRMKAGIDDICQTGGRVNRNFEYGGNSRLMVLNYANERGKADRVQDIATSQQSFAHVRSKYAEKELMSKKCQEEYFRDKLRRSTRNGASKTYAMENPFSASSDSTLYSMMACSHGKHLSDIQKKYIKHNHSLAFMFKTVSENYHYIDDERIPMIVREEGHEKEIDDMLEKFCSMADMLENELLDAESRGKCISGMKLIKMRLSRYSVSVFSSDINTRKVAMACNAELSLKYDINVLLDGFYDSSSGINLDSIIVGR